MSSIEEIFLMNEWGIWNYISFPNAGDLISVFRSLDFNSLFSHGRIIVAIIIISNMVTSNLALERGQEKIGK